MEHLARIEQLQKLLSHNKIEAFLIPSNDSFFSEFCPTYERRLEWLTGFSGSYGIAVITTTNVFLFTDGRYILQAKNEVPTLFKIINVSEYSLVKFLEDNFKNAGVIGFDPWLHQYDFINKLKELKLNIKPVDNLVDKLWISRPSKQTSLIKAHSLKYCGRSTNEKLNEITKELKNSNFDAAVITAPESVCWLLNIRGSDLPTSPLVLSYAIIHKSKRIEFFSDTASPLKAEYVSSLHLNSFIQHLEKLKGRILVDNSTCSFAVATAINNADVISQMDVCSMPKACKNQIEINGARQAHLVDGTALTKFLCWFDTKRPKHGFNEQIASEVLENFRKESKLFKGNSFTTISGFAENGAIIHYRVNPETAKTISGNGLYLIDSGGQYQAGTTDVTRTILVGKATKDEIEKFTYVLKGHIALASHLFKEGTTGSDLDILARQFLQQKGLDYDHGTGHGVGSYLNVHEGPMRISKMRNNIALKPGMIISNEPGYYETDKFGIRIENLVLVQSKNNSLLGFETLTLAPIDYRLINFQLLSSDEKFWLLQYHKNIQSKLKPYLSASENKWLSNIIRHYQTKLKEASGK